MKLSGNYNPKPIRKNKNTEIIFAFKTFGDLLYLDIREKTVSDEYTGFTKRGLCFNVSLIPEFIKNLEAAKEYLNSKTKPAPELVQVIEHLEKIKKIKLQDAAKLIKYCYKNEYFKEAVELYKLIDEEASDTDCFKETKKIIEVCRLKME